MRHAGLHQDGLPLLEEEVQVGGGGRDGQLVHKAPVSFWQKFEQDLIAFTAASSKQFAMKLPDSMAMARWCCLPDM